MYILLLAFSRHYMDGILPIRRKTQHNQSIIASFLSRPSRLDFNIIIINCKQSRLFWYFFAITCQILCWLVWYLCRLVGYLCRLLRSLCRLVRKQPSQLVILYLGRTSIWYLTSQNINFPTSWLYDLTSRHNFKVVFSNNYVGMSAAYVMHTCQIIISTCQIIRST